MHLNRQPTSLLKKSNVKQQSIFLQARPICSPLPSLVPKKPSPGSLAQGLKLYTEEEIEHTSGYTKFYRQFWNRKVDEINADTVSKRAANTDKVAARGAIDTAWAVEKAELLKLDADRLEMVVYCKDYTFSRKTHQSLKNVLSNVDRVCKTHAKIDAKYASIEEMTHQPNTFEKREIIKSMEDSIDNYISELKKANNALKKSIESCNAKVNIDKAVKHADELSAQKIQIENLTQEEEIIVKDLFGENEDEAMSPEK